MYSIKVHCSSSIEISALFILYTDLFQALPKDISLNTVDDITSILNEPAIPPSISIH